MEVILEARDYSSVDKIERELKENPLFTELAEYHYCYEIDILSGATAKKQNYFSVFGWAAGGNLKIFVRCPGEFCFTLDGPLKDIELVLDFLKIPKGGLYL